MCTERKRNYAARTEVHMNMDYETDLVRGVLNLLRDVHASTYMQAVVIGHVVDGGGWGGGRRADVDGEAAERKHEDVVVRDDHGARRCVSKECGC